MVIFERTDSTNTHFQQLVALLDADLARRDGDEHAFYAQFNKTSNLRHVIVCYVDEEAVACGAFREYAQGKVEIKRMFVQPAYRGKGLGLKIVRELELWATELDTASCVLETGKNQPEALRLYEKAGYRIIENYGQYVGVENSVCMEKNLG